MVNKEENLNLKHNTDVLIRKAIERYKTHREAYKALGLCERTFYNRISKLDDKTRYSSKRN